MASSFFSTSQPGLSNLSVRRLRLGTTLDFGFFNFLYERFSSTRYSTRDAFWHPNLARCFGTKLPFGHQEASQKFFHQRAGSQVIATLFRYFATFLVSALK